MRSRKPIGLLLDSVNDNVGDRAIRVVMEEFLIGEGIEYKGSGESSITHTITFHSTTAFFERGTSNQMISVA